MPVNVLDLFSGIGGFSLGLERAGMTTVAFCEIEPYPQKILKQHWPHVLIYDDVRELTHERLKADGIPAIDVVCGGFPCQDISNAGKQAGLKGERSGLWSEFARLIGELRPSYAIVENVSALLYRGLGVVLGDLAEIGYDAEWHCIPASSIGAPHIRDRIWIVAYPCGRALPFYGHGFPGAYWKGQESRRRRKGELNGDMPILGPADFAGSKKPQSCGMWQIEPAFYRVVNGVPGQLDRLRCLGNAVVPQIPEMIGRAIMNHD